MIALRLIMFIAKIQIMNLNLTMFKKIQLFQNNIIS